MHSEENACKLVDTSRGDLFYSVVAEGARSQPPKPGAQPAEYPQYASTAAGRSRAQILAEAAGAPSTRLPLPHAPAPPPPHRHPLLPAPLSEASGYSHPHARGPGAGATQRKAKPRRGSPRCSLASSPVHAASPPLSSLQSIAPSRPPPARPCPKPARHLQFSRTGSRPRPRPPRPWLPLSLSLSPSPGRCSRPHRSAAGSERAADARTPAAGGRLCPPRRQCLLQAEEDAINRGKGGGAPGPPAAAGDPQPSPSARRARRTAPLAGCSAELRVHGACGKRRVNDGL